jgi:Protein of unknown function (DUF2971)
MPGMANEESDPLDAELDRELPTGLVHHEPGVPLYQYTDAAGLVGILRSKVVWATQFQHLNDRREFLEGDELIFEVAKQLCQTHALTEHQRAIRNLFLEHHPKMAVSRIMPKTFIACFSELGDDLSQWRAYGGRGGGYSIGFRIRVGPGVEGAPAIPLGGVLLKVEYDSEVSKKRIADELSSAFAIVEKFMREPASEHERDKVLRACMVRVHRRAGRMALPIKHDAFKSEQEWRVVAMPKGDAPRDVIKTRITADGLVPYVEFPMVATPDELIELEAVYVGPTQDPRRGTMAARFLLESLGYDPALVKPSAIPFRG